MTAVEIHEKLASGGDGAWFAALSQEDQRSFHAWRKSPDGAARGWTTRTVTAEEMESEWPAKT